MAQTHGKSKYKAIKVNGKKHDLHRYLMEQHLGRRLMSCECVHHKNGDRYDNRLANLEVVQRDEHSRQHRLGQRLGDATKRKLGVSAGGASLTDAQVLAIRERRVAGALIKSIAMEFSISRAHAGRIAQGTRYGYVQAAPGA